MRYNIGIILLHKTIFLFGENLTFQLTCTFILFTNTLFHSYYSLLLLVTNNYLYILYNINHIG